MCNSRKLSVAEALCRNFKHMLVFLLALLLLMEGTAWNSYADEIINPSDSQTESQAQPTPAPTVKPIKPPASEENTEPIQEPDAPSGHDADTTTSDHTNTSDIQEPSSPIYQAPKLPIRQRQIPPLPRLQRHLLKSVQFRLRHLRRNL